MEPVLEILATEDVDGVTYITEARLASVSMVRLPDDAAGTGLGRVIAVSRGVKPSDSDVALPPLETDFAPTSDDIQRSIAAWDTKMPVFDGLLDATVDAE